MSTKRAHSPRTDTTQHAVLTCVHGLLVDTRTAALALNVSPQHLRTLATHPHRPCPVQPMRIGTSVLYRVADLRAAVGLPPLADHHLDSAEQA